MINPGLPEALWAKLDGRLWHATESEGLRGIVTVGHIKVALGNRYKSSFCRRQGRVSLFDFGPTAVDVPGKLDAWRGWFGHQQRTRVTIWLEIDRAEVFENLWDAETARKRWHAPPYGEFIHGVEACHKGPIPSTCIVSALLIDRDNLELFKEHHLDADISQHIKAFKLQLPPSTRSGGGIVESLWVGRDRSRRS